MYQLFYSSLMMLQNVLRASVMTKPLQIFAPLKITIHVSLMVSVWLNSLDAIMQRADAINVLTSMNY